jgi:hypothetical protein
MDRPGQAWRWVRATPFSRRVPGALSDAFLAEVRIKLSAPLQVRGATFAVQSADQDN